MHQVKLFEVLGHTIHSSLDLASPWKCVGCQMIAYSLFLMLLWINFKEKVIQMLVNKWPVDMILIGTLVLVKKKLEQGLKI